MILREAARAFNEKGVRSTSLDDVAARLGVTKPAIYHYVKSKDEILRQCLALALESNRQALATVQQLSVCGMEKLRLMLKDWPAGVVADFGRSMVTIDARELSKQSRKQYREVQRQILAGIEEIIQQGISDGSIRQCDPAVMTMSLIGLFNSPARWYRKEGRLSIDDVTSELLTLMSQGLTNTDRVATDMS